jgi:predicted nucleic acid-binding protein
MLILPSAGAFARARGFHTENGWSFWDAMIVAACLECGVTRRYSEDLPGSAVPGPLEIVNPFLQPG